jgi:hypothetical protein
MARERGKAMTTGCFTFGVLAFIVGIGLGVAIGSKS